MSSFLEEFEKNALGPVGWLRAAFPWIRKAMALRRTEPLFGLSGKALKAGKTKIFKPMSWHGSRTARELAQGKKPITLLQRPGRMAQALTGSILSPLYKAERNIEFAWKNPTKVTGLLKRHKSSFLHKPWAPPSLEEATGPLTRMWSKAQTKPFGVFVKRNPLTIGGNIHKRTPLGMLAHGALGTGAGIGALNVATTPGSTSKKIKSGVKGTIAWGPARNLTFTKIVATDLPKLFFGKSPRPAAYQQPYWQKAANKI